jgi:phosphohistidine phosphatase
MQDTGPYTLKALVKTLLLLRHAKSSWNDSSIEDRDRPLNARGRGDAPRMGDVLRDESLVPDVIISSDAVRAETTAVAVAEAAGFLRDIAIDPRLYLAGPDDLLAVVRARSGRDARIVMIVAHNPGLEDLIAQLTGERHDLPTATLVQLAVPIDTWDALDSSTRATLVNIWRPEDLSAT